MVEGNLVLRDIQEKDVAGLLALYPHWNRSLAEKRIRRTLFSVRERRVVAELNGQIVGHVKITYGSGVHSHLARVYSVIVSKNFRGKGIASKLMEKAISELLQGIEIVLLETQHDNASAIHLFEKLGFEQYGVLERAWKKGTEYKNNVLYRKVLR